MHSQHYKFRNEPRYPGDKRELSTTYVNIHHHGDYSGDAMIDVRTVPDGMSKQDALKKCKLTEIEVPIEALKMFIAGYIASKRTEKIENATTEELLS